MEPAATATQEDNPKSLLDRAFDLVGTDPQQVLALQGRNSLAAMAQYRRKL
jgi:hypothetical protein